MDTFSKEKRSEIMRAVKSKDSKIEIALRHALWARGYRYRKHYGKLAGRPDIVFVSEKIAVFCDSEFWHGYDWKRRKHDIKSNQEFWYSKIENTIARDKRVNKALKKDGWIVIRFWGREIEKNLDGCVNEVERQIAVRRNLQEQQRSTA